MALTDFNSHSKEYDPLAPWLRAKPVMLDKTIDLGDAYPKELEHIEGPVDLIINMSGHDLPRQLGAAPVEVWTVRDPIGEPETVYRQVRDDIEQRVLHLVETLRSRKPVASEALTVAPPTAAARADCPACSLTARPARSARP